MGIADVLSNPPLPDPPRQYQRHAEYDTGTGKGSGATGAVRERISDEKQLLELAGFDPDVFRIVGTISQWTKTHRTGQDTYSFFFQVEKIRDEDNPAARDLAALIRPTTPADPDTTTGLPRVVLIADGQIGKDGPDYPGPDVLDAAFHRALAKIAGIIATEKPHTLILADNGDPIEGITSSAPNQIATNWLELPDQLRLWQRRLTETILTLAPLAGRTIVVSVPSNHGEIRNPAGKVGYGDYGLGVARTVQEAFLLLADNTLHLEFVFPETKYDVVSYVTVDDTTIAFTHGHHAKQLDRVPQWVANQAANTRSRMGDARIVTHGHFHTPGYTWSRGREIISAPMFDAGSPWFTNLTGEWSPAGIATFAVKNQRVHDLRFVEP